LLIVVGSIQHESNTFCPGLCAFEDFDIAYGEDALPKMAPITFLKEQGAEVWPTIYANSVPSGMVERAAFDRLLGELLGRFPQGREINGVWLYCHGAMEVEGIGSGDAAIVAAVRKKVGPNIPITVPLDFHANNTEDIARHANIICGYRTAPHTDIAETQLRAARLLMESIERAELPVTALVRVPVIAAGDTVITDTEPMRSIIDACLKMEKEEGILSATVFNGQNWVDAENNSASAAVVARNRMKYSLAHEAALKLGRMLWEAKDDYMFQVDAMEPDDAICAAMKEARLPIFVSDSGDNTTAGAPGSSAFLLRSMLNNQVSSALLAGITCPSAVDACRSLAPGSSVRVDFGSERDGPGGRLSVQTILRSAGRLLGWDGDDGGECVVLAAPGVDIIATARPCAVISPEIIESSGVRLSDYGIVAVKLGYLYPKLAAAAGKAILALTPGVSCEDIAKINFTHVRRPMWPLDKCFTWPP
jgi:microcystin degradation protein MlrC